jgi:hypothetical protein
MARPRTRWKKPSGVTPLTVIRQLRAGDAKPGHQISSTGPKRVCEFCDFREDERETHDAALQDVAAQPGWGSFTSWQLRRFIQRLDVHHQQHYRGPDAHRTDDYRAISYLDSHPSVRKVRLCNELRFERCLDLQHRWCHRCLDAHRDNRHMKRSQLLHLRNP